MSRSLRVLAFALIFSAAVPAQSTTITLTADKDNTIYVNGNLSNGGGTAMFTGLSGMGERRCLLRFDVAGSIPVGATISGAQLRCNISNPNGGTGVTTMLLHRLLADWGEGTVFAASGQGGGGPAGTGDATWTHRMYPTVPWTNSGGDFAVSSSFAIAASNGPVVWSQTPALVADVQSFLDVSGSNFGWIVVGSGQAKRLDTHEHPQPSVRPQLDVVFTAPPNQKYPGNTSELAIGVDVDGVPGPGGGVTIVDVGSGDVVTLNFNSPGNSSYDGQGFFACTQAFVTGSTTGDPGGPAPILLGGGTAVHLDVANLGAVIVLVDSLATGGPVQRTLSPFPDISFTVPPAFAGLSLLTSCLLTDFGIPGDLIAVASAQELILPP